MKQRMMAIGLGAAMAGAMAWSGSAPIVAASGPAATARTQQVNGQAAVKTALMYLGTRYVGRGTSPATGFDDVGFVQWVYAQQGINLPGDLPDLRTVARQLHATGLHPGHLVFFKNTVWSGLSHVGIWMGKGRFIHAEWYNYGVTVTWLKSDPKDGSYWATHYLGRSTLATVPKGPGSAPIGPGSAQVGGAVVVVAQALALRSQPSLSARIVNILPEGTRLTVSAVQDGWLQVSVAGVKIGWVVAKYTAAVL
jgi:hypothetical protein